MLTEKKQSVEYLIKPLIGGLSKVNPNILTLIGSIPPLLFFVFVIYHHYVLALIACLGVGFDMIDGMVARKFHKVTAFGGFLDSTLDRVSDFLFITAFSFGGIIRWEISMPFLLCSFLTSYMRSRGELANSRVSFAIGILERSERLFGIFITLLFFMLFPQFEIYSLNDAEWIFLLLIVLSIITVMQRLRFAMMNKSRYILESQ